MPYLAAGFPDFDGFDAWLRADPVNRDDELFLLDRLERGNLHDVVRAAGQPDPAHRLARGLHHQPRPGRPRHADRAGPAVAAGDVLIVAALPDPAGTDRGHESVTLLNTHGGRRSTWPAGRWPTPPAAASALAGTLAGRRRPRRSRSAAPLQLGNQGDTIVLVDARRRDHRPGRATRPTRSGPGRTICFGR